MPRLLTAICLSLAIILLCAHDADARGRRRAHAPRYSAPRYSAPRVYAAPGYQYRYDARYRGRQNPYEVYKQIYPRYYGAFHSSHVLQYGYPPGDIGLRGFPW